MSRSNAPGGRASDFTLPRRVRLEFALSAVTSRSSRMCPVGAALWKELLCASGSAVEASCAPRVLAGTLAAATTRGTMTDATVGEALTTSSSALVVGASARIIDAVDLRGTAAA
eukprot:CAMPEP_0183379850 /NCGR_PEP_ID=MMETSP0164_2-20130417/125636_1 /TAXON_ID=221442 /ORGANISM="Coccolithus pelagicus ssp braarudi, Strain PLY182g" /LENGTH=113 /DNA_ID=CAMNT_0025557439 /DNA_START=77 /DNA_END=419 /DNA_ORIENTATION=-